MNDDILEGKWKQIRGSVRQWWGKLTDDDVDRIGGKLEKLLGVLQERYGWTRQQAEAEVKSRLRFTETQPTR
jgi:uncharacterized protein YjbJ (UPF0337 family)